MFELARADNFYRYKIYQYPDLIQNQQYFIESAMLALARFEYAYPGADSTWFFRHYNFFQMTAGNSEYHKLYKDLITVIRNYVDSDQPLWLQSWMNFHSQDKVLKRHTHENTICNGYLAVDPKESETVFDDYTIKNQAGQLYIGPNNVFHYVKVLQPYTGPRITLGFDVLDLENYKIMEKKFGTVDINTGYIPI